MQRPSISYWIIAIILTMWNVFGLVMVFGDPQLLAYSEPPQDQAELLQSRPFWALSASVMAVIFGTLGCIMLLVRKAVARPLFWLSLAGVIGQNIWFSTSETIKPLVDTSLYILQAAVIASIMLGLWLAGRAISNGWMR